MKVQNPAILYKAFLRGHIENEQHRLLATFNFENYRAQSREPFGSLTIFNDEVMAPGQSISRQGNAGLATLIIPLVGGLEMEADGCKSAVFTDEALLTSGNTIAVKNPYKADLVNFLYIQFSNVCHPSQTYTLNLGNRNALNTFLDFTAFKASIGIFDGRAETVYTPQPGNGLFAFAISGAFEIQGRLIEERDGLALWDTAEAELEALSENAVVLLFELVYP